MRDLSAELPEEGAPSREGIANAGGRVETAEAMRREQELCMNALASGNFDALSDAEWVALCESQGRRDHAPPEGGLAFPKESGTPADLSPPQA